MPGGAGGGEGGEGGAGGGLGGGSAGGGDGGEGTSGPQSTWLAQSLQGMASVVAGSSNWGHWAVRCATRAEKLPGRDRHRATMQQEECGKKIQWRMSKWYDHLPDQLLLIKAQLFAAVDVGISVHAAPVVKLPGRARRRQVSNLTHECARPTEALLGWEHSTCRTEERGKGE